MHRDDSLPPRTPENAPVLAPAGQLVLPGHGGQLGLDGASYAPEPRSGEPSLGPLHGVLHAPEVGSGHPEQLTLPLDAWRTAPQLSLWDRLDVRRGASSGSALVEERPSKCQVVRYLKDAEVSLVRSPSGAWHLEGVVSCGSWACPACGPRRARDAWSRLATALAVHSERFPDGDHWMLTLTVPHRLVDSPATVVRWLYEATALLWRSAQWKRFARRWGIRARVRVLDAVHGGRSGIHPHWHCALVLDDARVRLVDALRAAVRVRVRSLPRDPTALDSEAIGAAAAAIALLDEEQQRGGCELVRVRELAQEVREQLVGELAGDLADIWAKCVTAAGCPHRVGAAGVCLTPGESADRYFFQWGLAEEVSLSTSKARNHLRLLDVAATGGVAGAAAGELYRLWCEATRGRAWVTGLSDLCRGLDVDDAAVETWLEQHAERRRRAAELAGKPLPEPKPPLRLVVRAPLWRTALDLRIGPLLAELDDVAAALADRGPELAVLVQRALDDRLWRAWRETHRRWSG